MVRGAASKLSRMREHSIVVGVDVTQCSSDAELRSLSERLAGSGHVPQENGYRFALLLNHIANRLPNIPNLPQLSRASVTCDRTMLG